VKIGLKAAVTIAILACASHGAAAQQNIAPLPKHSQPIPGAPRRSPPPSLVIPRELAPPQEIYAAFPESPTAAAAPPAPSACQLRLGKIATFQALPVLIGPGECGATDAVILQTITLSDQDRLTVSPPATLRCPMAEEVAHWVREDVAPSVAKLGAPLRGLDNFDSYECRGRNRVRGATLSEHGRADALDVRLFKLADGRELTLTDIHVNKDWREQMKATVCARFSTVLGPGSDGNHEEHIHLDLAERHNNYKICEWDVREPVVQVQAHAAVQAAPPPADETSDDQSEPQAVETAAPLPPDTVPLPRPRPPWLVHALQGGPAPR
jgi:hypothetical protein